MNRPSRGDRRSATTTRHTGSLRPPTRVSLMLTDMRRSSLAVAHQLAEVGHPALLQPAHELAHLAELLDELVDLLHGRPRPLGDPQPPRALDQLRPPPLLRGHAQNNRLHPVELLLVHLHLRELVAGEPRD